MTYLHYRASRIDKHTNSGDIVMLLHDLTVGNEVYVAPVGNTPIVKRVDFDTANGTIVLMSINPAYASKVTLPEEIIVYGKLPRKSIKVPTYTGGTTSPDFVYSVRDTKLNGLNLHLIVETKSDNPRLSDIVAVEAQREAFGQIGDNIKWNMVTNVADFQRDLEKLAKEKP